LKLKDKDPRAAGIVFAVLTTLLIGLTIAGIVVCGKDIGTLSVSTDVVGFNVASFSVTVGFNTLTASGSVLGTTVGTGSQSIDSNQCPSSQFNSITGWAGNCGLFVVGNACLPPAPFGMWAGSKACAALACLFLFILVVLYATKKQSGCSICGLSWLALILTSAAVGLAATGALSFLSLCSGGLSNSVSYTAGDGAKLLAASVALQFIFWLFAQCTAAPASSTQTVVIMQNQPAPQMYAPNVQPMAPQYAQPAQQMAPQYPQPVAHHAPNRPLPYGWEALTDASGNRYYGNPSKRITQYEFPNA